MASLPMDRSGGYPRLGAAAAAVNSVPANSEDAGVDQIHSVPCQPLARDVLAWASRKGYTDMEKIKLDAVGALLDMDMMIVPPVPRSEIMAALEDITQAPLTALEGQDEIEMEHADPLMDRLEAIGALVEVDLRITLPPSPCPEIIAALDPLAEPPLGAVGSAPEELDVGYIEGMDIAGDAPPPPQTP